MKNAFSRLVSAAILLACAVAAFADAKAEFPPLAETPKTKGAFPARPSSLIDLPTPEVLPRGGSAAGVSFRYFLDRPDLAGIRQLTWGPTISAGWGVFDRFEAGIEAVSAFEGLDHVSGYVRVLVLEEGRAWPAIGVGAFDIANDPAPNADLTYPVVNVSDYFIDDATNNSLYLVAAKRIPGLGRAYAGVGRGRFLGRCGFDESLNGLMAGGEIDLSGLRLMAELAGWSVNAGLGMSVPAYRGRQADVSLEALIAAKHLQNLRPSSRDLGLRPALMGRLEMTVRPLPMGEGREVLFAAAPGRDRFARDLIDLPAPEVLPHYGFSVSAGSRYFLGRPGAPGQLLNFAPRMKAGMGLFDRAEVGVESVSATDDFDHVSAYARVLLVEEDWVWPAVGVGVYDLTMDPRPNSELTYPVVNVPDYLRDDATNNSLYLVAAKRILPDVRGYAGVGRGRFMGRCGFDGKLHGLFAGGEFNVAGMRLMAELAGWSINAGAGFDVPFYRSGDTDVGLSAVVGVKHLQNLRQSSWDLGLRPALMGRLELVMTPAALEMPPLPAAARGYAAKARTPSLYGLIDLPAPEVLPHGVFAAGVGGRYFPDPPPVAGMLTDGPAIRTGIGVFDRIEVGVEAVSQFENLDQESAYVRALLIEEGPVFPAVGAGVFDLTRDPAPNADLTYPVVNVSDYLRDDATNNSLYLVAAKRLSPLLRAYGGIGRGRFMGRCGVDDYLHGLFAGGEIEYARVRLMAELSGWSLNAGVGYSLPPQRAGDVDLTLSALVAGKHLQNLRPEAQDLFLRPALAGRFELVMTPVPAEQRGVPVPGTFGPRRGAGLPRSLIDVPAPEVLPHGGLSVAVGERHFIDKPDPPPGRMLASGPTLKMGAGLFDRLEVGIESVSATDNLDHASLYASVLLLEETRFWPALGAGVMDLTTDPVPNADVTYPVTNSDEYLKDDATNNSLYLVAAKRLLPFTRGYAGIGRGRFMGRCGMDADLYGLFAGGEINLSYLRLMAELAGWSVNAGLGVSLPPFRAGDLDVSLNATLAGKHLQNLRQASQDLDLRPALMGRLEFVMNPVPERERAETLISAIPARETARRLIDLPAPEVLAHGGYAASVAGRHFQSGPGSSAMLVDGPQLRAGVGLLDRFEAGVEGVSALETLDHASLYVRALLLEEGPAWPAVGAGAFDITTDPAPNADATYPVTGSAAYLEDDATNNSLYLVAAKRLLPFVRGYAGIGRGRFMGRCGKDADLHGFFAGGELDIGRARLMAELVGWSVNAGAEYSFPSYRAGDMDVSLNAMLGGKYLQNLQSSSRDLGLRPAVAGRLEVVMRPVLPGERLVPPLPSRPAASRDAARGLIDLPAPEVLAHGGRSVAISGRRFLDKPDLPAGAVLADRPAMQVGYGLFDRVEIGVEGVSAFENLDHASGYAKILLVEEAASWPAVGVGVYDLTLDPVPNADVTYPVTSSAAYLEDGATNNSLYLVAAKRILGPARGYAGVGRGRFLGRCGKDASLHGLFAGGEIGVSGVKLMAELSGWSVNAGLRVSPPPLRAGDTDIAFNALLAGKYLQNVQQKSQDLGLNPAFFGRLEVVMTPAAPRTLLEKGIDLERVWVPRKEARGLIDLPAPEVLAKSSVAIGAEMRHFVRRPDSAGRPQLVGGPMLDVGAGIFERVEAGVEGVSALKTLDHGSGYVRVLLLEEGRYWPAVGAGVLDITMDGAPSPDAAYPVVASSEYMQDGKTNNSLYVVAAKRVLPFARGYLGMGRGRFMGRCGLDGELGGLFAGGELDVSGLRFMAELSGWSVNAGVGASLPPYRAGEMDITLNALVAGKHLQNIQPSSWDLDLRPAVMGRLEVVMSPVPAEERPEILTLGEPAGVQPETSRGLIDVPGPEVLPHGAYSVMVGERVFVDMPDLPGERTLVSGPNMRMGVGLFGVAEAGVETVSAFDNFDRMTGYLRVQLLEEKRAWPALGAGIMDVTSDVAPSAYSVYPVVNVDEYLRRNRTNNSLYIVAAKHVTPLARGYLGVGRGRFFGRCGFDDELSGVFGGGEINLSGLRLMAELSGWSVNAGAGFALPPYRSGNTDVYLNATVAGMHLQNVRTESRDLNLRPALMGRLEMVLSPVPEAERITMLAGVGEEAEEEYEEYELKPLRGLIDVPGPDVLGHNVYSVSAGSRYFVERKQMPGVRVLSDGLSAKAGLGLFDRVEIGVEGVSAFGSLDKKTGYIKALLAEETEGWPAIGVGAFDLTTDKSPSGDSTYPVTNVGQYLEDDRTNNSLYLVAAKNINSMIRGYGGIGRGRFKGRCGFDEHLHGAFAGGELEVGGVRLMGELAGWSVNAGVGASLPAYRYGNWDVELSAVLAAKHLQNVRRVSRDMGLSPAVAGRLEFVITPAPDDYYEPVEFPPEAEIPKTKTALPERASSVPRSPRALIELPGPEVLPHCAFAASVEGRYFLGDPNIPDDLMLSAGPNLKAGFGLFDRIEVGLEGVSTLNRPDYVSGYREVVDHASAYARVLLLEEGSFWPAFGAGIMDVTAARNPSPDAGYPVTNSDAYDKGDKTNNSLYFVAAKRFMGSARGYAGIGRGRFVGRCGLDADLDGFFAGGEVDLSGLRVMAELVGWSVNAGLGVAIPVHQSGGMDVSLNAVAAGKYLQNVQSSSRALGLRPALTGRLELVVTPLPEPAGPKGQEE